MSTAMDFAKYFIQQGLDTNSNTYDGNMKLQKLLFFADIISLAEYGNTLFQDDVCAFSNGCVIEPVRLRYKNDYISLHAESQAFVPSFTDDENKVLALTVAIFGGVSARELSELNHGFDFWRTALERSKQPDGYKDKVLSVITPNEMVPELNKIRSVVDSFEKNKQYTTNKEIVNGIIFLYSDDMEMSDDILEKLDDFSRTAEDDIYSVYLDGKDLVIY